MKVAMYIVSCALAALLGAPVPQATAGSIVGTFDWADQDDLQGWSENQDWVTLSNPGTGGAGGIGDGYLNIELAATSESPPTEWFALTTVDASRLFAGTWQSDMWVEFDFWANDVAPAYVDVRWAGQSSSTWSNRVFDSTSSSMKTQTWTRLMSAQFENYEDWDYGSGTQEQFVNDLASIDWIGVYVFRNTADAQDYGLDNFSLMVPEPTQSMMLLASAATVVLSLRKKKRGAEKPPSI